MVIAIIILSTVTALLALHQLIMREEIKVLKQALKAKYVREFMEKLK